MSAFRKFVFFALIFSNLNLTIYGQEDQQSEEGFANHQELADLPSQQDVPQLPSQQELPQLPKQIPELSELLLHGEPLGRSNDSLNGRFEEKVELPESVEENMVTKLFEDSVNRDLKEVDKSEESEVELEQEQQDSAGLDLPKREEENKYLQASDEDSERDAQAVDAFGGEVRTSDIQDEVIDSPQREQLENGEDQDSQENKGGEADDNFYRAKSYDVEQGANEYSKEDLGETRKKTSYSDEQEQDQERYSSEDEQFNLNDSEEAVEGGMENSTEGEEEEEKDAWYNAEMDDEDEDEDLESDEDEDDEQVAEWGEQYKKWNENQIGNTEEEEEQEDSDENEFNKSDNFDDDDDAEKLMIEEVVGEELAKKNKPPTGPSSMVIFYTWMVVALLVLVVAVSTYQSRCKGVKEGGGTDDSNSMLTFNRGRPSQSQDSKRLLDHEYA